MTSNRLEYLKYEKNRLVDVWNNKSYTTEARILVRIMDLEEDIAEEQLRLKKKSQNSIAV